MTGTWRFRHLSWTGEIFGSVSRASPAGALACGVVLRGGVFLGCVTLFRVAARSFPHVVVDHPVEKGAFPVNLFHKVEPESDLRGDSPWSTARPAFATAVRALPLEGIAAAYVAGTTLAELAERAGVSRQTIARILTETSTPLRRGGRRAIEIEPELLRRLYVERRMSLREVGQLFGRGPRAIARQLDIAQIAVRPPGYWRE